jgi:hypothetical protein
MYLAKTDTNVHISFCPINVRHLHEEPLVRLDRVVGRQERGDEEELGVEGQLHAQPRRPARGWRLIRLRLASEAVLAKVNFSQCLI